MDLTSGLTATQKAVDSFKSAPTWALFGVTAAVLAIWQVPALHDAVPVEAGRSLPAVVTLFALLTACRLVAGLIERRALRRDRLLAGDRQRLDQLYGPLRKLFLTRHITVAHLGTDRLPFRIAVAWSEFGRYKRRRVGVQMALSALFPRPSRPIAEMQYGSDFPLSAIVDLVHERSEFADEQLFLLVNQASRSRLEQPGNPHLTDEELDLYSHVEDGHRQLLKRIATRS